MDHVAFFDNTQEHKIWSNPAWKKAVDKLAAEKGINEEYVAHYRAPNPDASSWVALDAKENLVGILMCDHWFGHKGIEDQLYIGLLVGKTDKICMQLLEQVQAYAMHWKFNKHTFKFVSSMCLADQLPLFHKQGFHAGFSNSVCKGSGKGSLVPPGAGKAKGKVVYEIHKCIEDMQLQ